MSAKELCKHGSLLPRGLKCDRNYLVIRLKTPAGPYYRCCGAHTKANEKVACLALNQVREKLALGRFELPQRLERIKFSDALKRYFQMHYTDWRDEQTHAPRTGASLATARGLCKTLEDYFGDFYLDAIAPKDVVAYKRKRIEFDGVGNAAFNREKGFLSSMFTMFSRWVAQELIDALKLPAINPCLSVPDLRETSRDRVASIDELKRIKSACFALHDEGMWSIVRMELDTTARKSDLMRLNNLEEKDGTITFKQGKTGNDVTLPALIKANRASVFENLRKRWEAVRGTAGLVDLQFRDLRRTGAQMLKKLGYSTELIKDTLGHADARTTKLYLNHKDADAIRPLVEARRKLLDTI